MASPPKHVTDAAQSSKVVFIKLFVIVDPPAGSHCHAAASALALARVASASLIALRLGLSSQNSGRWSTSFPQWPHFYLLTKNVQLSVLPFLPRWHEHSV